MAVMQLFKNQSQPGQGEEEAAEAVGGQTAVVIVAVVHAQLLLLLVGIVGGPGMKKWRENELVLKKADRWQWQEH
jgi:hypothetical protein